MAFYVSLFIVCLLSVPQFDPAGFMRFSGVLLDGYRTIFTASRSGSHHLYALTKLTNGMPLVSTATYDI
jgi:hypothetical protein